MTCIDPEVPASLPGTDPTPDRRSITVEHWRQSLDTGLLSPVQFIEATIDGMVERGWGRIVNIASTEGLGATEGVSAYTVAKHGVVGLTRALAVELEAEW